MAWLQLRRYLSSHARGESLLPTVPGHSSLPLSVTELPPLYFLLNSEEARTTIQNGGFEFWVTQVCVCLHMCMFLCVCIVIWWRTAHARCDLLFCKECEM